MSATPILDLESDPPRPRSGKLTLAICLLLGAAIGFAPASFGAAWPALNVLLWFPALYLMIAIHEIAHLAVGKWNGMDPGGIVVGGFVVLKSGTTWKFRFDKRRIFGGGMAVPLPKNDFRLSAYVWMVAAGPIASVICTLICWLAFMRYGSGTWDWIGSAFWASSIGLFSLIPMSAGLHKSDAARVWMLLRQPARARAWMAAVSIQAENYRGVRPREWDAALASEMLAVPQTGAGRIFPELMGYYRALDHDNRTVAFAHIEQALAASAKAGKAVRQALFFEAAEIHALLKNNPVAAQTWLDRGMKLRKSECPACAQGAVAISQGRFADAVSKIDETRAYIEKRSPNSGLAIFAKERLAGRRLLCENSLRALSSGPATASASA